MVRMIKCPECDGTGQVECKCYNIKIKHMLYSNNVSGVSSECRYIGQCADCHQIYHVRKQFNYGTGEDNSCEPITAQQALKLKKDVK